MTHQQEILLIATQGSSLFSNFTMGGNFLPDINGDAAKWRDSGIEELVINSKVPTVTNYHNQKNHSWPHAQNSQRRPQRPTSLHNLHP